MEQLSRTWIRDRIEKAIGDELNKGVSPEDIQSLRNAYENGTIRAMLVKSDVREGVEHSIEIIEKTWDQIGERTWRLAN